MRDGTVMEEEEERRDSSSGSSACAVGTTTQGFDSSTPKKGNMAEVRAKEFFDFMDVVSFHC